jgi:hypothetical protein
MTPISCLCRFVRLMTVSQLHRLYIVKLKDREGSGCVLFQDMTQTSAGVTEESSRKTCRIWGSHGGEYEDGCLEGDLMWRQQVPMKRVPARSRATSWVTRGGKFCPMSLGCYRHSPWPDSSWPGGWRSTLAEILPVSQGVCAPSLKQCMKFPLVSPWYKPVVHKHYLVFLLSPFVNFCCRNKHFHIRTVEHPGTSYIPATGKREQSELPKRRVYQIYFIQWTI